MEDVHVSSDQTSDPMPLGKEPSNTPPKAQSRVEQTKNAGRKVLALITGRSQR